MATRTTWKPREKAVDLKEGNDLPNGVVAIPKKRTKLVIDACPAHNFMMVRWNRIDPVDKEERD